MRKLLLLLLVSGVMMFGCNQKPIPKGEPLPALNVLLLDSSTIINTAANTPKGKAVVMLYFSPDCKYCQEETEDIIKNIDVLQEVQFYYISPMSMKEMKPFFDYYQLQNYENIFVAKDYKAEFYHHFKPKSIPFQVVFGHDGTLLRKYEHGSSANSIIRTLSKS